MPVASIANLILQNKWMKQQFAGWPSCYTVKPVPLAHISALLADPTEGGQCGETVLDSFQYRVELLVPKHDA